MGNENTSGEITGNQRLGFGLCFGGIAIWLLMALKILIQMDVLDEIAWLGMGGWGWPYEFAVGLLCFIQGRQMLCRASVEATPSKPDDDSGSTE